MKAVIIGFSHMHVNEIAKYISEADGFELIAIAKAPSDTEDIEPLRYTPLWNFENVRTNYCQNAYEDYREMLEEISPDYAFILSENRQKLEIATYCAKKGINICIEKPMALNADEAREIMRVANECGVKALVNWPVVWRPYLYKLAEFIDRGVLGAPIKMNYLNGHTGPLGKGARHRGVSENAEEMTDAQRAMTWWHQDRCGGGVYLDIACYGAFFTRWFMKDRAGSVMAQGANLATPFGDTHDNFAAIIKYEDQMSIIEGTWTTPRAAIPSGPSIVCENGVVFCSGGAENMPDVKAFDIYGNEVAVNDTKMNLGFENVAEHILFCEKKGLSVYKMLTLSENVRIMEIIDAVQKSAKTGTSQKI